MSSEAENRLQDIWIWNGRPNWDEIFAEMLKSRQHSDIGVCFCGAPVIGADLASMSVLLLLIFFPLLLVIR